MIKAYLIVTEYLLMNDKTTPANKLRAVHSVKMLLDNIDFSAEVIPGDNPEKLATLLSSIKGEPLTQDEYKLIDELVEMNTGIKTVLMTNKTEETEKPKQSR